MSKEYILRDMEMHTASTLAKQIGLSRERVTKLCQAKRIKATKAGRIWLVNPNEAKKLIDRFKIGERPLEDLRYK